MTVTRAQRRAILRLALSMEVHCERVDVEVTEGENGALRVRRAFDQVVEHFVVEQDGAARPEVA